MWQAEIGGGTANAPEARPAKGQLIRDFTLPSTLGEQISLSNYRGQSNLVLVFAGEGDGVKDRKMLTEIAAGYTRFQEEQAQALIALQCPLEKAVMIKQRANLLCTVLVDEDGRVHRSAGALDAHGHPSTAVYVADRFGEVFAVYRVADGQEMPTGGEIVEWLSFINSQCPECGVPEWPV